MFDFRCNQKLRTERKQLTAPRNSNFMKWIDQQVEKDSGLNRKVAACLTQMMIEQKLAARGTQRGTT